MKLRTNVGLTGIALATTAAVLVASPNATSAATTKSFAYGISINGQGKQPYVESTDGTTQHNGGQFPDQASPLVAGGVLALSAGDDTASADLADLTLGNGLSQLPPQLTSALQSIGDQCSKLPTEPSTDQLQPLFDNLPVPVQDVVKTPENLQSLCDALGGGDYTSLATVKALNVQCAGDAGTVKVEEAKVANSPTPLTNSDVKPNTPLLPSQLDPLIKITLNRQTPHRDGSFTVDGMVIDLGGNQGEIILASTTCGIPIKAPPPGRAPTPPRAPAPKPVQHSAPVTG